MVALKENLGYASLANSRRRESKDVHLMTDRSSHMRYLESQLERMSAACSTVGSFDCRIEDMRGQVTMLQDKVVNLARALDAQSHSVEDTAAAFRHTATDLSRKQQEVHDLLFGGTSEKGISSGTLSEGAKKFLEAAYEKWLQENQCQLTSQVNDVQTTVENAVQNIFRDVEQASCTYQNKLTETKDHLSGRVGDLENRLEAVAASQLNLCTPVVDSMKNLQEETRQQIILSKSDLRQEIASLAQALEQHKLQSRAEQCDTSSTVQKLQEQTSELATGFKRLEQAYLQFAAATHSQRAVAPHSRHYNATHLQPPHHRQQPHFTHSDTNAGFRETHLGQQDLHPSTTPSALTPSTSADKGTMTQPGTPGQQCEATYSASHVQSLSGEGKSVRSAGTCTGDGQTRSSQVPIATMHSNAEMLRTPSQGTRGAESNGNSAAVQVHSTDSQCMELNPECSNVSMPAVTPAPPFQSTSLPCGTGQTCVLQPVPFQQQHQAMLPSNAAQVVVLPAQGGMHPLNSAMLQQCWSPPEAYIMQLQTSKQLTQQCYPCLSLQKSNPSRRESRKNPDSKRSSSKAGSSNSERHVQSVSTAPESHQSCPADACYQAQGCSASVDSLPQSTVWACSPIQHSDGVWKEQYHSLHTADCREATAPLQLPPRPSGRKTAHTALPVAPRHHPESSTQNERNTASAQKTPRLSTVSSSRRVEDRSESGYDSSQAGEGGQSHSACPSTLDEAPVHRRRTKKGKKLAPSNRALKSRTPGPREKSSASGSHKQDDGHAAGINGHLSPRIDSTSPNSTQDESPQWNSPETLAPAGSPPACPACDTCMHRLPDASHRGQAVHRCTRNAQGTLRQASSKAASHKAEHGRQGGKQLVRQAYLAATAMSDASSRGPNYAKPTRAALLRRA